MKKKFFYFLISISFLSILISCSGESSSARGSANLRIELNRGVRTIAPESSEMEVKSYRIELTGPDGEKLTPVVNYYSYYTFEDLEAGTWFIEVWGRNNNGVDVSYGSKSVNLRRGPNTVVINLDKLVGKGTLNCSIRWDASILNEGRIQLFLSRPGEEEKDITSQVSQNQGEGSAYLTLPNLASGSYILRGVLYQNNVRRGGFSEAIRISNGKTLYGEIDLKSMEENAELTINFANLTSLPLEANIHGVSTIVKTRDSFIATLKLITPNVDESNVTCSWYLDGIFISNGLYAEVRPTNDGNHRLDAVFYTGSEGSTGSATALFSSLANSSEGTPYRLNEISSINELTLGLDHVASFLPDGAMLVASNSKKEIHKVNFNSSGQIINAKTFSYQLLNIEGTVVDMASVAREEDEDMTVYVITNNSPAISAINYNKATGTLSKIKRISGIKSFDGSTNIAQFGEATPFVSSNGDFRYVVVSAATPSFEQIGILSLSEEANVDEDFVILNNVVVNKEPSKTVLRSLAADSKSNSVTLTTATSLTTFILEVSASLPGFIEHYYADRQGNEFGQCSEMVWACYYGGNKSNYTDWGYFISNVTQATFQVGKSNRLRYIYGVTIPEKHKTVFKKVANTMDGKTNIFLNAVDNLISSIDFDKESYTPYAAVDDDVILVNILFEPFLRPTKINSGLPVNANLFNAIELAEDGSRGVLFNRGGSGSSSIVVFDIIPFAK